MKKHIYAGALFSLMFVLDFVTKYFIDLHFEEGERIRYLGGFFQIIKIYNRGGVFGIGQGHQYVFLTLSVVVFIILMGYYLYETVYNRVSSTFFSIMMALVFSGAIGNITDRILGKPGVVDFIYIGVEDVFMWPAFNIADMCIVCGAIGLATFFWMNEKKQKAN
ncbi:MAG: signal peptidase II [Spirochaetes bacterium]|jgi:signal peptidase II|nr:signal peptidase II [Spirochaetota bacterium]